MKMLVEVLFYNESSIMAWCSFAIFKNLGTPRPYTQILYLKHGHLYRLSSNLLLKSTL